MDTKGGLGKGLSALFENKNIKVENLSVNSNSSDKFQNTIPIEKIRANPYQPREDFDVDKLKELAESIKVNGLLQPITVKIAKDGNGYILISGERRLRAAKIAGVKEIPAYIYSIEDESKEILLELALIENVQRENLNPMELSDSYQRLIDDCDLTQEQIAAKVSKQRSTVGNSLRLQRLPAEIKVSLRKNEISEGHARTILRLESPQQQIELWQRIIAENLSVRNLEDLTKLYAKPKRKRKSSGKSGITDPYYEQIENKLRMYFGTRVKIKPRTKQTGEIIIDYFTPDDLERIIELTENK